MCSSMGKVEHTITLCAISTLQPLNTTAQVVFSLAQLFRELFGAA